MKKLLFTIYLLYGFIISVSQMSDLRYKQELVFIKDVFHPLLLCLRKISASKFFEIIILAGVIPNKITPPKIPNPPFS